MVVGPDELNTMLQTYAMSPVRGDSEPVEVFVLAKMKDPSGQVRWSVRSSGASEEMIDVLRQHLEMLEAQRVFAGA